MRITQRLLLGVLAVIAVLVVLVVVSLNVRLRRQLQDIETASLTREARLVGDGWHAGLDADSLANAAGRSSGHRVTLIAPDGTVLGDSEFESSALGALENHATRPEVVAARETGVGSALRMSPSAGDEELYAAVRTTLGVARVSATTRALQDVVRRAQRDVYPAAGLAALTSILLAILFARSVARPIVELRDDARAIAAGDLARRPSLTAPGEVGELATAFHRLAEQLGNRLQALEADDALLRTLMESLNEGVVALDERQQVIHLNDHARRLLQVDDAVPFSADRLPRDRLLRESVASALKGEATDDLPIELHGRTVTLTARPLSSGGAVLSLFDLTTVRKLETIRRDFVANVSHELKTPLTVVRGFSETLLDESLSPADRRRFAETILSNTGRMQRLVDDLLDLSRIESGGWAPRTQPVDVEALATEVFATVRPRAAATGLSLNVQVAPDARVVNADGMALRQILTNLVDNAIRHTTHGGISIIASRNGPTVAVAVRDTGVGIPPEHLARVFERFYRVDAARSREEGGTGLGLAIVKHMVEAHGGRVTAESTPGSGTTITATFPDATA